MALRHTCAAMLAAPSIAFFFGWTGGRKAAKKEVRRTDKETKKEETERERKGRTKEEECTN